MKNIVSLAIFAILLSPVLAMGGRGHHKAKMFKAMDKDGDGKVSKAEWIAHKNDRFAKMDANGDGFLEKEEIKKHHKMMRKKHRK